MTNEEKALQIASLNGYKGSYDKLMFRSAMQMAEWKDKQYAEVFAPILIELDELKRQVKSLLP